MLDLSTSHNGCCYKAAEGGWSLEHVAAAKELLEGQIVQVGVPLAGLGADTSWVLGRATQVGTCSYVATAREVQVVQVLQGVCSS